MTNLAENNDLQVLVQELSKEKPDATLVKNKTEILGIPYNSDLIVLMSEVLLFLSKNQISSKDKPKALKEKLV